jgi:hypothetical protein
MSARKSTEKTGKGRIPKPYEGRINYTTIEGVRAAPDHDRHNREPVVPEQGCEQKTHSLSVEGVNDIGKQLWIEGNGQ